MIVTTLFTSLLYLSVVGLLGKYLAICIFGFVLLIQCLITKDWTKIKNYSDFKAFTNSKEVIYLKYIISIILYSIILVYLFDLTNQAYWTERLTQVQIESSVWGELLALRIANGGLICITIASILLDSLLIILQWLKKEWIWHEYKVLIALGVCILVLLVIPCFVYQYLGLFLY